MIFTLFSTLCFVGNFSSAMGPPRSGSFRRNDVFRHDDDVPIIKDSQYQSTRDRKRRRREQTSNIIHRDNNLFDSHDYDADDSDDSSDPFFFLNHNDNQRWKKQNPFDRMWRRSRIRQRRQNHSTSEDDLSESHGLSSSVDSLRHWTFAKTGLRIPRINFHFDPINVLKIRKSWHQVIPGAIIRIGADFETQHRLGGGIWRLRGCIEDKFIGGRFTVKGKRKGDKGMILEYSKSWLFAGAGSVATRLNLSAQYDMNLNRGSARFGFRSENLNNGGTFMSAPGIFGSTGQRQCLSLVPIIPLDGPDGHFKLEAKTSIELPEPEVVFGMDLDRDSADSGSVGLGFGDVDLEVDELNIICHF